MSEQLSEEKRLIRLYRRLWRNRLVQREVRADILRNHGGRLEALRMAERELLIEIRSTEAVMGITEEDSI